MNISISKSFRLIPAIALCSVLAACGSKSSSKGDGGGGPDIPGEKAAGQVNGKALNIQGATAKKHTDSSGKEMLVVTLSSAALDCKGAPTPNTSNIILTVPASVGKNVFPAGTAEFSYNRDGSPKKDISTNSVIIIDSIDNEVKGRVSASYESSSINGAFVAVNCSPSGKPTPVPAPPVDGIKKIFDGWGEKWSGDQNITTPGKYGELSVHMNKTLDQPKPNEIKFQMGGMCSYADMGKGGVGLYWGSDSNGAFLTVDGSGRIFLNCQFGPMQVGTMTETEIRMDTITCEGLESKEGIGQSSFSITKLSQDKAHMRKHFPATPPMGSWPASPAVDCYGDIDRK